MLTTTELLARLTEKGIVKADIARSLRVSPSRVTELYNGTRALKLDEAVRLVETFALESQSDQRVPVLPARANRLLVLHIARQLGQALSEDSPQLQELAEDLRAFSEFVTDPRVRESIDLQEAFLQAFHLRRPEPAKAE